MLANGLVVVSRFRGYLGGYLGVFSWLFGSCLVDVSQLFGDCLLAI